MSLGRVDQLSEDVDAHRFERRICWKYLPLSDVAVGLDAGSSALYVISHKPVAFNGKCRPLEVTTDALIQLASAGVTYLNRVVVQVENTLLKRISYDYLVSRVG